MLFIYDLYVFFFCCSYKHVCEAGLTGIHSAVAQEMEEANRIYCLGLYLTVDTSRSVFFINKVQLIPHFLISCKQLDDFVNVKQSHYRPEVPRGFNEVKVPRLHNNDPG